MRKLSYLLAGLLLTMGLVGMTFGATKSAAKSAEKVYAVKGSISAVDTAASTVTVKAAKGDVVLTVDANTKIKVSGQSSDLNGLKVGDSVSATYKNSESKKLALSISVKASTQKK